MFRRLRFLATAAVLAGGGPAYGQLVTELSLVTSTAPGDLVRYEYVIENLPESELTVNAFVLDVGEGADIQSLEHPDGWYGEFLAEEDPFELAWVAQGPQYEIPVGGSGTFGFTSPLGPEFISFYLANLTAQGAEVDGILSSFPGPAPPQGIPGDYNDNGLVEQGDLDLVLLNWGVRIDDLSGNWANTLPVAFVDQAELDRVLLNWGRTSATGEAAAVPEPAGCLLAIVGGVLLLVMSRRTES